MATGMAGMLLLGVAALVAVVVVLAVVIGRGRKRDWAEPMSQSPGHATDRTGYGAAGTSYPTAPPPATRPSLSEPVWPTAAASGATVPGEPTLPGGPVGPTVPGPAAPPSQPEPPVHPIPPSPTTEPPVPGQPPVPGEPPVPGGPPDPTESFQPPARRLDDSLRFREQNRPDGTHSE